MTAINLIKTSFTAAVAIEILKGFYQFIYLVSQTLFLCTHHPLNDDRILAESGDIPQQPVV